MTIDSEMTITSLSYHISELDKHIRFYEEEKKKLQNTIDDLMKQKDAAEEKLEVAISRVAVKKIES